MKTRNLVITSSIIISVIVLITMIIIAFLQRRDLVCEHIIVQVENRDNYSFIKAENIASFLNNNGIKCVGLKTSEINLLEVENTVKKIKVVRDAVCYFNMKGDLYVKVWQRIPQYRVKSLSGDYFVDDNREIFPANSSTVAYVPLITGKLSTDFATNQLFDLISFIENDRFLATAFTQITVNDERVSLIPRVGNFVVVLGDIDNFESKLTKYKTFIKKVYKYKEWNKYSVISLEYKNQVVCTERENA